MLPVNLIESLQAAKSLRESADYHCWSKEGAQRLFRLKVREEMRSQTSKWEIK